MVPFPLVLKYLLVSPLHRWHGITATRVSLSWYCQGARPVPCQTVDWVTLKYTRLWLHDFFHYQSLIWHNNRYEKVASGLVRRCLGCTNWEMDERTRECSRSGGNSKCSLCFFWGSWIGGAQSRASAQKLREVNPRNELNNWVLVRDVSDKSDLVKSCRGRVKKHPKLLKWMPLQLTKKESS